MGTPKDTQVLLSGLLTEHAELLNSKQMTVYNPTNTSQHRPEKLAMKTILIPLSSLPSRLAGYSHLEPLHFWHGAALF